MNEVKPRARAVAHVPKAREQVSVARVSASSKKNVTISRGTKAKPEKRAPLKKVRKERKKAMLIFFGILSAILILIGFYVVWLPTLRINEVEASGLHAEEVRGVALRATYGTHLFIIPRNSIFFIPESDIRKAVLGAFPDIEAISLSASNLNTLTLTSTPRALVFEWCGTSIEAASICYSANAEGLVFAEVPQGAATTSVLKVYGPLDREIGDSPLRARVSVANRLPEVLRMIRAVETLGSDVTALAIREDEADLYLLSGTRVTYVIGREEQAAGLAASVFPQLNLNDGSVLYVDLRFDGKVYYRKSQSPE
ncbi:MAG: hypothetical protein AB199_02425 [Parcubacteria bacterium C7867-004]|nr:MAG: hypothetical protein AB199_02425 [Parcubacteria bacterium C7867-004]